MLRGDMVYLRPVRQDDLPLLETWAHDSQHGSEFNFFGLEGTKSREQRWQVDELIGSKLGTLLVVTMDEQIVGDVSYHHQRYGPNEASTAYNIGIELVPEGRGKGYGTEAQSLLAEYLFLVYPIMRVEASTDITNIAEQRSLEKAGFSRDGLLRQAQWRSGSWHDLVLYSKLRGE